MNNYCVQQKKDLCSFFKNETHNEQKKIHILKIHICNNFLI